MGDYHAERAKAKDKPKPKHTELYLTGKREIFRIIE